MGLRHTRDLLSRIEVLIVSVAHRVGTYQPAVLGITNVAAQKVSSVPFFPLCIRESAEVVLRRASQGIDARWDVCVRTFPVLCCTICSRDGEYQQGQHVPSAQPATRSAPRPLVHFRPRCSSSSRIRDFEAQHGFRESASGGATGPQRYGRPFSSPVHT